MKSIKRFFISLFRKDLTRTHNPAMRNKILEIESVISKIPGAKWGDSMPLKHTFVDGAYVREIFMPKGTLVTSKIHKIEHPYFILRGDVSVLTEEGVVRIKAPYYGITPAGTKRAIYVHEDTTWITVHVTKHRDLKKIEKQIIAKNYDEIPENITKKIEEVTDEANSKVYMC